MYNGFWLSGQWVFEVPSCSVYYIICTIDTTLLYVIDLLTQSEYFISKYKSTRSFSHNVIVDFGMCVAVL